MKKFADAMRALTILYAYLFILVTASGTTGKAVTLLFDY